MTKKYIDIKGWRHFLDIWDKEDIPSARLGLLYFVEADYAKHCFNTKNPNPGFDEKAAFCINVMRECLDDMEKLDWEEDGSILDAVKKILKKALSIVIEEITTHKRTDVIYTSNLLLTILADKRLYMPGAAIWYQEPYHCYIYDFLVWSKSIKEVSDDWYRSAMLSGHSDLINDYDTNAFDIVLAYLQEQIGDRNLTLIDLLKPDISIGRASQHLPGLASILLQLAKRCQRIDQITPLLYPK